MLPETLSNGLPPYAYLAIFLLAIVEGPVVMTLSGFLLKLGYFSFWPLYVTLMAGDLAADTIWYSVGYYGKSFVHKYGYLVGVTDQLIEKTTAAFHRHQNKILFLSKITMGLGFALVILITAGIARIPFKKYLAFNAVGQFVWTAALMAVGYFFGTFYLVLNKGLRAASLIAFVIILVGAIVGVNRYLRKKDIQNQL